MYLFLLIMACGNVPSFFVKALLPPDRYKSLEARITDVNIAKAGFYDLKSCRKCEGTYSVDAGANAFFCCGIFQCILCGDEYGENHLERFCFRRVPTLEDRLSEVEVRRCPTCCLGVTKIDGCNEMTCAFCFTKFGYLCREVVVPKLHFCKCQERFSKFDGKCTCGRYCIQFGNANEYDERKKKAIRDEYAGVKSAVAGAAKVIEVITIDDDSDDDWALPMRPRRGRDEAETQRRIENFPLRITALMEPRRDAVENIDIDSDDDWGMPMRTRRGPDVAETQRRIESFPWRNAAVRESRRDAVENIDVDSDDDWAMPVRPRCRREENIRERGSNVFARKNDDTVARERRSRNAAAAILERHENERRRRLPQEIIVTHQIVPPADEIVIPVYQFLTSAIPRNPTEFPQFAAEVNRIWRVRIERWLNLPAGFLDERRRYTTLDGRNGYARLLFERIRVLH
uniref:RING-type domain-containing protein n=1 Tax=Panagrolaimus sp. ES5 TaxID=591445 RepID=A0AC34FL67_9BILA